MFIIWSMCAVINVCFLSFIGMTSAPLVLFSLCSLNVSFSVLFQGNAVVCCKHFQLANTRICVCLISPSVPVSPRVIFVVYAAGGVGVVRSVGV